jgi:hypothetical protein
MSELVLPQPNGRGLAILWDGSIVGVLDSVSSS